MKSSCTSRLSTTWTIAATPAPSAKLKALESRYPFGRYADQAQLELIYANYKNTEPEAAKSAAERFIRLHPQHPNVDYAYYLKGLTSFDQDVGLLARFLPLDMTKRDPGAARDSYNEFAQLTSRFPNSRYAPDAKQRMIYLRNLLAAYEIHVADYYLTRQAYVAAANRGRYVVENFQETPSVGDGLAVMTEAYQRLHLDELAATSLETLKLNYPNHPSLVDGQFVAYRRRSRQPFVAEQGHPGPDRVPSAAAAGRNPRQPGRAEAVPGRQGRDPERAQA